MYVLFGNSWGISPNLEKLLMQSLAIKKEEKTFDTIKSISKTMKLQGTIKAPPSKSYTHRAIIIGSMNSHIKVINPLICDDTLATIKTWKQLGADIDKRFNYLDINGFNGKPKLNSKELNVNESGTLLRFLLSILAYSKDEIVVNGRGTLLNRTNKVLVDALSKLGVNIKGNGEEHKLPIKIKGDGKVNGGEIEISGKTSSQVISSLLIAAPLAQQDITIIVKDDLVSKPYIDITIDVLELAGINIINDNYKIFKIKCEQEFQMDKDYIIHGDYSSAAFLMAAACLVESNVTITDLVEDKQGDIKILDILERMGAKINRYKDRVNIKGPFCLNGIDIDCNDTPDLVPVLTVLGIFAKNKTRIYNIDHLIHKESNRITDPAGELKKLGAKINITEDNEIIIHQSKLKNGKNVSSRNDHRIAMSLALVGLKVKNIIIEDPDCISKSYPDFFYHMRQLGANIE